MQGRVNQKVENMTWKYGSIYWVFFHSSFVSSSLRGGGNIPTIQATDGWKGQGNHEVDMCQSEEVRGVFLVIFHNDCDHSPLPIHDRWWQDWFQKYHFSDLDYLNIYNIYWKQAMLFWTIPTSYTAAIIIHADIIIWCLSLVYDIIRMNGTGRRH